MFYHVKIYEYYKNKRKETIWVFFLLDDNVHFLYVHDILWHWYSTYKIKLMNNIQTMLLQPVSFCRDLGPWYVKSTLLLLVRRFCIDQGLMHASSSYLRCLFTGINAYSQFHTTTFHLVLVPFVSQLPKYGIPCRLTFCSLKHFHHLDVI